MFLFVMGFSGGVVIGVVLMCLIQIGRVHEYQIEHHYGAERK